MMLTAVAVCKTVLKLIFAGLQALLHILSLLSLHGNCTYTFQFRFRFSINSVEIFIGDTKSQRLCYFGICMFSVIFCMFRFFSLHFPSPLQRMFITDITSETELVSILLGLDFTRICL